MIIRADARAIPLADKSVHCCVTSPPYWGLRDYGVAGQIGRERTPEEYISSMVKVFREVSRVLRDDGTLWLNIGDSYAGSGHGWCINPNDKQLTQRYWAEQNATNRESPPGYISTKQPNGLKPKDLVGVPWMLAFALRSDGWYLRSDIIWHKKNPMPESVKDRPTRCHEYIFLLSKSERYFYNADAIAEPAIYFDDDRKGRASAEHKSAPTEQVNGIRPRKSDKQRGHSRRHNGFNDRWDAMTVEEQCSGLRNKRDVWQVSPAQFPEAHFATFPEELIKPCILAGCPGGGFVLDPFVGSGTTVLVAKNLQCKGIGLELNPEYIEIAKRRLSQGVMEFSHAR